MNEYNLLLLVTFILMGAVSNMRSQNPGIVLGSKGSINDYLFQDNTSFGDKTDEDLSWDAPMQSTKLPYDYFRVTSTTPDAIPGAATFPSGNSGDNSPTINTANNEPSAINYASDFVGPTFESRNNKDLFYSETDNNMLAPENNSDGENGDSTSDDSTPQDENLIKSSRSIYGIYKNTDGMTIPGLPVDDSSDGVCSNNSPQIQRNSDFTGPVFDNYLPNYAMGEENSDINDSNSADNTDRVSSYTFSNRDFKGPVFNNYNSNGEQMPGSILPSNSIDASADSYGDSNLEPFKVNQPISSYFYGPVLANQCQPADSETTDTPDMENSNDNMGNSFSHESGNGLGIKSFVGPVFSNYANNEESMPGTLSQATNQSNMQNQNVPTSTSQTQNTDSTQSTQTQNNLSTTPINSSTDNSENNDRSSINTQYQNSSSSDTNNTPTPIPTNNIAQSQNEAVVSDGDMQSTQGIVSPVVNPTQNPDTTDNSANSNQSSSIGNLNQLHNASNNGVVTHVDNSPSNNSQFQTNDAASSNDQSQSSTPSNQITKTLPITSTDQAQTSQDQIYAANSQPINVAIPANSTNKSQNNVVSNSSQTQNNVNVITQNTPDSSFDNTNQNYSSQSGPNTVTNSDLAPEVSTEFNSTPINQATDVPSDTLSSNQDTNILNDQQNFIGNNQATAVPIQPQDIQASYTPVTSQLQTVTDSNSTGQKDLSNTTSVTKDTTNANNQQISAGISNADQSKPSTSNPSLGSPEPNHTINISPANNVVGSSGISESTSSSSTSTSTGSPGNGTTSINTDSSESSPTSNGSNSSSSNSNNTGTNTNAKFLSTNEIPTINSISTTIKANIKLYLLAILFIGLL